MNPNIDYDNTHIKHKQEIIAASILMHASKQFKCHSLKLYFDREMIGK